MIPPWFGAVLAYLGQGLLMTLWISALTVSFSTVVGVVVGGMSSSSRTIPRAVARIYVEIFRGVPSLLTLLFVFFALPHIGVKTSPIAASTIGLGLWGAANIAETVRGAINSISSKQTLSARALGMSPMQAFVYVIFPQAVRRFLPPYVGQLTVLIQSSALTSIVGVGDLLGTARQMIERLAYIGDGRSHALIIYGLVLAAFFIICYSLTMLARQLEKRLRV